MTKVVTSEDCGNSPKNIFVQEVTIALIKCDAKFALRSVAENIRWDIIGRTSVEGRDNLGAELERLTKEKPVELIINHVVTHGKAGAANGILKLQSGQQIAFCNVYEFTNAKGDAIQRITSYNVVTG